MRIPRRGRLAGTGCVAILLAALTLLGAVAPSAARTARERTGAGHRIARHRRSHRRHRREHHAHHQSAPAVPAVIETPPCPATTYPGEAPADPVNEPGALLDARRLLSTASLPAGTVGLAGPPSGVSLVDIGDQGCDQYAVGYEEYWRSSETPAQVARSISGPAGSGFALGSSGEGSSSVTYAFPPQAGLTVQRQLTYTLAADAGGTAIEIAPQDVWLNPRPASEAVPDEEGETVTLTVTSYGESGQATPSTVQVTDPEQVADIVALTNALPVEQAEFAPPACPADPPGVSVVFDDADGNQLAQAGYDGCGEVAFAVGDTPSYPLDDGYQYYDDLQSTYAPSSTSS